MMPRAASVAAVATVLALGLAFRSDRQRARHQPLTLADALTQAAEHSEAIQIAKSGEDARAAQSDQVFSQRLPQVNFAGTYSRTLASEFEHAFSTVVPVCDPFTVDATKPVDRSRGGARARRRLRRSRLELGFNLSRLPFGQRNIYQLGLTFSQAVYTGGRVSAQLRQAGVSRRVATLETTATEAQLRLDVTRAFYDAALSDRLVAIAESVSTQAGATYDQTRLAFEAGRQPEFELLRAQVARDNQRPTVIRRRADRDVAYLRLRQLLELPPPRRSCSTWTSRAPISRRRRPSLPIWQGRAKPMPLSVSPLHSPRRSSSPRDAALGIARSGRMPSVGVASSYARVGYPSDGVHSRHRRLPHELVARRNRAGARSSPAAACRPRSVPPSRNSIRRGSR